MFIFKCRVIANDVNVILDNIDSNIVDIVIRTVNEITGNYTMLPELTFHNI